MKSIEIEFKTLMTDNEYNKIIDLFDLRENIFSQENYYFDTDDFYIRKNCMELRIRHRKNVWKITLKSPHENCMYEDSIIINETEANYYIKNGFNLKPFGLDLFVTLKVSNITERAVTPYKEGNLFLDKSTFAGTTDYEIEYEADEPAHGIEVFREFLNENGINYKPSHHKVERAYIALKL